MEGSTCSSSRSASSVGVSFDDRTRRAALRESQQPGDEDLLNVLAVRTVLFGGTVYAVRPDEMPDGEAVAALFRY
jgi:hypothetical protein